jgi:hypothetical protein
MPFGTGRMCGCNNDFCIKSPLCDYNTLTNPYDSSSGIDKNQFEKRTYEYYDNLIKSEKNNNYIIILIIIIIIIIYLLSKK